MAEKITVTLVDDIDGTEASHTRRFTVDGKSYRIDLSDKNNEKFDKALAAFVSHAIPESTVRASATRSSGRSKPARDYDIGALRAWAEKNDIGLPSRGRIPFAIVDQFKTSSRSK